MTKKDIINFTNEEIINVLCDVVAQQWQRKKENISLLKQEKLLKEEILKRMEK